MNELVVREVIAIGAVSGWTYIFGLALLGHIAIRPRDRIPVLLAIVTSVALAAGALYPSILSLDQARTGYDALRVALLVGAIWYIRPRRVRT